MSGGSGIRVIHQNGCASRRDAPCNCDPSYQGSVWDSRTKRRVRRNFSSESEAYAWRADALRQLRTNPTVTGPSATIRELGKQLLEGMRSGLVRTRSGDAYKPATVRSYEQTLRIYVYPELGGLSLAELRRRHVQDLIDRLVGEGVAASTVRNSVMPLRVICRRAIRTEQLTISPVEHLELPAVRTGRDRVASPSEAAQLIAALEPRDTAIWGTAFYAGLRRGELMALTLDVVDLDNRVLHVRASWDIKEGRMPPKSRAGERTVPIGEALADLLADHIGRLPWTSGLVFGRSATTPFDPSVITERAYRTWERAGLPRYSLHEARHTFVTFLLAAGVHVKAVSTFAGHASIAITLDRYGHLLPGAEKDAARRLDQLLGVQSPGDPSSARDQLNDHNSHRAESGDAPLRIRDSGSERDRAAS